MISESHPIQAPWAGETADDHIGMPGISQRKKPKYDNEIEIAPLIDMVFLLLIFFLVTSTMERQSSIDLPRTEYGVAVSERNATTISVEGKGANIRVYLGDNIGGDPLPDLTQPQEAAIARAVEAGYLEGKTSLVIKADREVHTGEISRIIRAATNAVGELSVYMVTVEDR
ncbi:MAG: biopolymer transporter ExbD [Planctomycetaceae bacterium]|nr:biopolymer transporter ExbD [Planctomycetaceae bacterium]